MQQTCNRNNSIIYTTNTYPQKQCCIHKTSASATTVLYVYLPDMYPQQRCYKQHFMYLQWMDKKSDELQTSTYGAYANFRHNQSNKCSLSVSQKYRLCTCLKLYENNARFHAANPWSRLRVFAVAVTARILTGPCAADLPSASIGPTRVCSALIIM